MMPLTTVEPRLYDEDYYAKRDKMTREAALEIASLLKVSLPFPKSVVDFGCGIGTWLSVFQSLGSERINGYDGPWVDKTHLAIPRDCFHEARVGQDSICAEHSDLAICLEVAEHIEPYHANELVATLTNSADVILFSAAIPGQGGTNHVNEQWPPYWVDLFNSNGFDCFDLLRDALWERDSIPFWYRQNLFVSIKRERSDLLDQLDPDDLQGMNRIRCVVHPVLFTHRQSHSLSLRRRDAAESSDSTTVRGSARLLLQALARKLTSNSQ